MEGAYPRESGELSLIRSTELLLHRGQGRLLLGKLGIEIWQRRREHEPVVRPHSTNQLTRYVRRVSLKYGAFRR